MLVFEFCFVCVFAFCYPSLSFPDTTSNGKEFQNLRTLKQISQLQDDVTWTNENLHQPSSVSFRKLENSINDQSVKTYQTVSLGLHFIRAEDICAAI